MTAEHKSAVEALADEWESDHGILSPDSRFTRDVLLRELREAIAADRAAGALDPDEANALRRSKSALVEKVKRLEDQIARAKMEPGQDRQKAMHAYAERAEQAEALARQEFDKATEAIERAEQAEIALAAAETKFQQARDDALAEAYQAIRAERDRLYLHPIGFELAFMAAWTDAADHVRDLRTGTAPLSPAQQQVIDAWLAGAEERRTEPLTEDTSEALEQRLQREISHRGDREGGEG